MRSYEIKSQSDENSESLVLYTLAQIGVQSLWVGIYMGIPPHPLDFPRQKKTTVNELSLFFYFSFFLQ